MTTFENFKQEVFKINADFQSEQDKAMRAASVVVAHIQKELINPLCEKHNMTFSTTEVIEGSFWSFGSADPDVEIDLNVDSKDFCSDFMSKKEVKDFLALADLFDTKICNVTWAQLFSPYSPKL